MTFLQKHKDSIVVVGTLLAFLAFFAGTVHVESRDQLRRDAAIAAARDASEAYLDEATGANELGWVVASDMFGPAFAQSPGGAPNPGIGDPARLNGVRVRTGTTFTIYDAQGNAGPVFTDQGTNFLTTLDGNLEVAGSTNAYVQIGASTYPYIQEPTTTGNLLYAAGQHVFGDVSGNSLLGIYDDGATGHIGLVAGLVFNSSTFSGAQANIQATSATAMYLNVAAGGTIFFTGAAGNLATLLAVGTGDGRFSTERLAGISANGLLFEDDAGNDWIQFEDGATFSADIRSATGIFEVQDSEVFRVTAAALTVPNGVATNLGTGGLSVGGGTAVTSIWTGTASLNAAAIIGGPGCVDANFGTITVTGADVGDPVELGYDTRAFGDTNLRVFATVTAADTVTVDGCCFSAACANPPAVTFRATVYDY